MNDFELEKKPAFFPFVSAEVFFEAESAEGDVTEFAAAFDGADLDAELDAVLGVA